MTRSSSDNYRSLQSDIPAGHESRPKDGQGTRLMAPEGCHQIPNPLPTQLLNFCFLICTLGTTVLELEGLINRIPVHHVLKQPIKAKQPGRWGQRRSPSLRRGRGRPRQACTRLPRPRGSPRDAEEALMQRVQCTPSPRAAGSPPGTRPFLSSQVRVQLRGGTAGPALPTPHPPLLPVPAPAAHGPGLAQGSTSLGG